MSRDEQRFPAENSSEAYSAILVFRADYDPKTGTVCHTDWLSLNKKFMIQPHHETGAEYL